MGSGVMGFGNGLDTLLALGYVAVCLADMKCQKWDVEIEVSNHT